MQQTVLGISTLYQRGKTQLPADVRKKLNLKDGEKLVYYEDSSGKIYISTDKIEEPIPSVYFADKH